MQEPLPAAPRRIVTDRLVVRCWTPDDAAALRQAVDESLEHLLPWMPWARDEPQTVAEKRALLADFAAQFEGRRNYVYGVLDLDDAHVLGGSGLHPRVGPGALEIGYWVHADAVRQGVATEAAGALTRVALERMGVDRVVIRCDPANVASAGIPARLGYRDVGVQLARIEGWNAPRETRTFELTSADLPGSGAAAVAYRVAD